MTARSERIEELLDAVDMELWLDDQGIDYKPTSGSSGPQFNIRECPFCGGSEWKVYMNQETGKGNCFHGSCEQRFGKWGFIRRHLGDPPVHAMRDHLRQFARDMGWRPPKKQSAPVEIPTTIALPDSYPLPIEGRNLRYLEERGIGVDLAAYFHLRYCDEGWWNWVEDGQRRGSRFDKRIIIPVFDMNGQMVTFQGRDITGTSTRKYLFPSKLPATGRHIYNIQNAVGCEEACLGEGAFDVWSIKAAFDADPELRGVAAIGSFGKHLSYGSTEGDDQLGRLLQLKRRGLKRVTIMWDGEAKVIKDAINAWRHMASIGLKGAIALLPPGKDPNEVTGDIVRRAYKDAVTLDRASAMRLLCNNPYNSHK